MSMLTFYINRAGKQLSRERRKTLLQAKDELRDLYGRPRQSRRSRPARPRDAMIERRVKATVAMVRRR